MYYHKILIYNVLYIKASTENTCDFTRCLYTESICLVPVKAQD